MVFPFFAYEWLYFAVHRAGGLLIMLGVHLRCHTLVWRNTYRWKAYFSRRLVEGLLIPGICRCWIYHPDDLRSTFQVDSASL